MLWSSYILFIGTSFYHKCFYLDVYKDYWELWYLKVPKSMFKGLSHRVIIILWLILSASENTSFRKLKISDGLQNKTAYRNFKSDRFDTLFSWQDTVKRRCFELVTYLLFLHHFKHFLHVCVCLAIHGAAMDVVAVLSLVHDKNTYVGHRAQIHKVPNFVLKEPLVEQCEK